MQGPKIGGAYEGRIEDCRAAIMPLLEDYLIVHPSGIADARTVEVIILPAARAAGWSKGDVALALRTHKPSIGATPE